nr:hypothetical protein [Streptomyces sp. TLI_235]
MVRNRARAGGGANADVDLDDGFGDRLLDLLHELGLVDAVLGGDGGGELGDRGGLRGVPLGGGGHVVLEAPDFGVELAEPGLGAVGFHVVLLGGGGRGAEQVGHRAGSVWSFSGTCECP